MLRRLCVALTLGILMLAALAQGAAADPINSKNSFSFTSTCGGQQVDIVAMGPGRGEVFAAAHLVGSTSVFVLQALDVTSQFTLPGGPTETETLTASKHNLHGDLVTCTFDVSETSPEGTFWLFGSATSFFTPAS